MAEYTEPAQQSPEDIARHWLAAIKQAEKHWDTFFKRGEKITNRYRAQGSTDTDSSPGARFNIFWSNVQTLAPATYSRRPKVEVYRRFRDQDDVGRLAATILQRALQYEVDIGLDFHRTLQACVLDRLLPGQACAWVRYQPSFGTEQAVVPDPANPLATIEQSVQVLKDERTPVDYIFYKDFLISPARAWGDVRWVAKRVMFAKDALKKRFGESCQRLGGKVEDVPCNYDPAQPDPDGRPSDTPVEGDTTLKRSLIWELHDKESGQIIWVVEGYQYPLDLKVDPIGLENFFPCPRPLQATTTNDTLIPVPDFVLYQHQILELDDLTARIAILTRALRVVGVYDRSNQALADLLKKGDNQMIPVDSWAAFAEKGGLKGMTDWLPVEQIIKVLEGLYEAREVSKQVAYEITGMADIVRGATQASETLGAQRIKAKFANLRLSSRQQQVAEFATQLLEIKAEVMCHHYSVQTLARISSADQIQEAQAHPDRLQAALQLLKDERTRRYRIQVAEGSMIELDEVGEQERRDKFMSSIANFMNAMKNVAQIGPEMIPVVFEMLKFVVRGFSTGRELESAIEDAMDQVKERMSKPPPPPQPEPGDVLKAKVEAEKAQLQAQVDTAISARDNETKKAIADMQAAVDLILETLKVKSAASEGAAQREHASAEAGADRQAAVAAAPPTDALGAKVTALLEQLSRPRRKTLIFNEAGEVTGAEETPL